MSTVAIQAQPKEFIEFVPFGATDKIKLSLSIIQKLVAVPTRSGAKPSDRDCLRFMMLCQSQHLNPFAGDCYLVGYDGKNGPQFSMITAHVAFLKRAESHPDYEGMESGVILLDGDKAIDREGDFIVPGEEVVGAWARVHRKNRKATYRRLAVSQRKPKYESDFWSPAKMPEQMVKCAEADALRATFPTLLGGLLMREENNLEVSSAPDLPVNGLVQVQPAKEIESDDGDRQHEIEAKGKETLQEELCIVIGQAGFTFAHFQRWGEESGSLKDATSFASFDDIPTADCERLLRSLRGARSRPAVLAQLEKCREALL